MAPPSSWSYRSDVWRLSASLEQLSLKSRYLPCVGLRASVLLAYLKMLLMSQPWLLLCCALSFLFFTQASPAAFDLVKGQRTISTVMRGSNLSKSTGFDFFYFVR